VDDHKREQALGQIQTMDQRSGCVVETGYHNRSDRLDRIDETFDGLIECQRALKFEPLCRSNSRSSHKPRARQISHSFTLNPRSATAFFSSRNCSATHRV
jgi:hypothetical protein